MVVAAVDKTAKQSTTRAPLRSRYDPIEGDKIAASTPPKETAPEIAVRDQPNSVVIGVTKLTKWRRRVLVAKIQQNRH